MGRGRGPPSGRRRRHRRGPRRAELGRRPAVTGENASIWQPRPYRLRGRIRNYHWGSRSLLAELRGEPPSARPEAELWYGTHPGGPASIVDGERSAPLAAVISARPDWWLGTGRGDRQLPFLIKLLAAATPLSIQVHPSVEQARRGFAREEESGRPVTAPDRVYRDRSNKPEILRALSPFTALYGFRPRAQIGTALADLGLGDLLPGTTVRAQIERMVLLEGRARADFAARVLEAASHQQTPARRWSKECRWIQQLAEHYPEDPWILAPLLLHLVELDRGEALFTEAGVPHAYLEGLGVELMNSSDNVIRAGLTSKPVDPHELLRVVDSRKAVVVKRRSVPDSGSQASGGGAFRTFRTPAEEFELSELSVPGDDAMEIGVETADRLELLLVARGAFELRADADADADAAGRSVALGATDAAVVPAACARYRITGSGLLFRARTPLAVARSK
ncbi:MAG: mannose-6-phosphate isomerase, class I [Acidobacteria bacterium]|nr:MAG: mannose-6-phosphate isomerase, class I [Acidobacteriota bacterium]